MILHPRDVPRFLATVSGAVTCNSHYAIAPGRTPGRRGWSDGVTVWEVKTYTSEKVRDGAVTRLGAPLAVAAGWAPSAKQDDYGRVHLFYSRAGALGYKVDTNDGTGYGTEMQILPGYSCATAIYVTRLHRIVLLGVKAGRLKAVPLVQQQTGQNALTPLLDREVDLGPTDSQVAALTVNDHGLLQAFWGTAPTFNTLVSGDGGKTWTQPTGVV